MADVKQKKVQNTEGPIFRKQTDDKKGLRLLLA